MDMYYCDGTDEVCTALIATGSPADADLLAASCQTGSVPSLGALSSFLTVSSLPVPSLRLLFSPRLLLLCRYIDEDDNCVARVTLALGADCSTFDGYSFCNLAGNEYCNGDVCTADEADTLGNACNDTTDCITEGGTYARVCQCDGNIDGDTVCTAVEAECTGDDFCQNGNIANGEGNCATANAREVLWEGDCTQKESASADQCENQSCSDVVRDALFNNGIGTFSSYPVLPVHPPFSHVCLHLIFPPLSPHTCSPPTSAHLPPPTSHLTRIFFVDYDSFCGRNAALAFVRDSGFCSSASSVQTSAWVAALAGAAVWAVRN